MENHHGPIPGIDWDAVWEVAAADAANEGENDEIVLDENGDPVGAFGLGMGHGQPPEGQFQLENHIPNMFGDENLGINPNAGLIGAEPGEEAPEIAPEELEQVEQQHFLPAIAALAIGPPPPAGLNLPHPQILNLKRGAPWDDRTNDAGPMSLKKNPRTYKPTQ